MAVRRASVADRAAVMRIAAAGMREFGIEPEFDTLDVELARVGAPAHETGDALRLELVAEEGGQVVGSLLVISADGMAGKVSGFYVDPSQRGRGTGRALLAAALQEARAAGLRELTLLTWEKMGAAIRLYEGAGFTRIADPAPEEGADRAYRLAL